MYKTVLFDFDGTVFDTGEGVMKSVQYAAEAFGFPVEDFESLRSFVGPPMHGELMRRFGVDEATAFAMMDKFRERYAPIGVKECAPYAGVAELVAQLRAAGAAVAVATGKPTIFARQILAEHGMAGAFDDVVGSELDGTRSQKWEVVSVLKQKYGGEGMVMVGDRDNDVFGSAKCGVPCIGVSWGYASPGELESAGVIALANNVDELKDILFR